MGKINAQSCQAVILLLITLSLSSYISLSFIAIVLLIILWSLMCALEQLARPSTFIGNILALAVMFTLVIDVGFSDTVNLFVSMLLSAIALKQLIAIQPRHIKLIAVTQTFLIASIFLYQQNLMFTLISLLLLILNLLALNLLADPAQSFWFRARLAAKTLVFSLPIALVCFLIIPKLPSFWALPGPTGATTGLNETVNPFDIAKLSRSSELVFRAKFNQNPPTTPFYWRAMIHEEYADQGWDILEHAERPEPFLDTIEQSSTAIKYEIIAEKSSIPWLYGLNYAQSSSDDMVNRYDGILARNKNLSQSIKYQASSEPTFWQNTRLSSYKKRLNTEIDTLDNPYSQQLAQALRAVAANDEAFFNSLMGYFAKQGFSYTLTPPPLRGLNTIDQFMQSSKKGFCGHYASSAAFIFRSAGIPARVVSGYLGGEKRLDTDYYNIYQYDAHAWTEVWLEGQGWTIFDATKVIAPDRLNGSLSQSESHRSEFLNNIEFGWLSLANYPMVNWLYNQVDYLDFVWTAWVLGYDNDTQQSFLADLFGNWSPLTIAMSVLAFIFLLLLCYYLLYRWQNRQIYRTALAKEFLQLQNWAKKNGSKIDCQDLFHSGATPLAQLNLLAELFPQKATLLQQFASLWSQVRYQSEHCTIQQQQDAKNLVAKIIKREK
ncbi:transglutaminase family protein [Pseudoalteromonas tunicata]|uniref:transglutaminase family protein n=1 Tax=Pseudoalteromonas tunicata TaxID=314281 RepID=UPI00273FF241|nr:DUF3488 and transglutaminase-like domain-containing protein [Pseudoalteromonas tunicata]MDP4982759.1 DUF3488 and transglutaminase-like domain-containing protein [Pseudoalteromonas tunicata]